MSASALFVVIIIIGLARGLAAQQDLQIGPNDTDCTAGAIMVRPGESIQAVVNEQPMGAKICLLEGVHRSRTIRPKHGQHFVGAPKAILSGSVPIENFIHDGRHWTKNWSTALFRPYGECAEQTPQCNFSEAVFLDNKPLKQVLTREAVSPGHFYVDRAERRLFLGDDPRNHKIEITAVDFAIKGPAKNIVIENLIIEKYSSPAQHGAIHAEPGSSGWTIRNAEVRYNSGAAIYLSVNGTVKGSVMHHNGQIGIVGSGDGIRITGNEIWANNVSGFDYGWEAGGIKIARSQSVLFHANRVYDNIGHGIWCDIDCKDVTYTENYVAENYGAGIFYEISQDATIRNNKLRRNGLGDTAWFWGADIQIAGSKDVLIEANHIEVDAGGCAIMLVDQGRPNARGGTYETKNVRVYSNEMIFDNVPCAGGVTDANPGEGNYWIISLGGNAFDKNSYNVRTSSDAYRFIWGHDTISWDAFRAAGQEQGGRLSTSQ